MESWKSEEDALNRLKEALSYKWRMGSDYADAEYQYQIAKSKAIFELDKQGVSSTIIKESIRGYGEVAELRHKKMLAQICYEANQEAILVAKLELRILEEQVRREWGNEGNDR